MKKNAASFLEDISMAKKALVNKNVCVACGVCAKACPKKAIEILKGCYARVWEDKCVGCGICAKNCPAGCITVNEV